jgi:hypothetical protein
MAWHILYRVPAGYRVAENTPYASENECKIAIRRLAWAAYEDPIPQEVFTSLHFSEMRVRDVDGVTHDVSELSASIRVYSMPKRTRHADRS